MSEKNTGGPAFPCGPRLDGQGMPVSEAWDGMTLRDYLAAKAMHQMLAGAVLPTQESRDKFLPMVAEFAYQMADFMLKARES